MPFYEERPRSDDDTSFRVKEANRASTQSDCGAHKCAFNFYEWENLNFRAFSSFVDSTEVLGKCRALWWLILCHSKTRWDFIAFYCCGIYISALNNWCARQGITNNHAQLDSLLLSLEDTHKKRPKSNFLTSKWKSVASFSGRITSFSNLMFASKEIYNRKWSDSAFSAFIRLSKRIKILSNDVHTIRPL